VPGTTVMRVDLVAVRAGFSSGHYQTRNVLFLDPAEKNGRWLLPDSRHELTETVQLHKKPDDQEPGRPLATCSLVKQADAERSSTGRLLIFDPVGKRVQFVADEVNRLHVASIGPAGEVLVLYERDRKFVTAVIDPASFAVEREQAFEIPPLK